MAKSKAKKIDEKQQESVIRSVKALIEVSEVLKSLAIRILGEANGIAANTGLHTEAGRQMTPAEIQAYTRRTTTPFGEAEAPPEGEVPDPENGEEYTAKELAKSAFTRPVLAKLHKELGGDPKGKMAPELRTEILQMQTGEGEKEVGECEITGDEDVELTVVSVEGDEYKVGPRVIEAVEAGDAQWDEIMDGEYEFE